MPWPGTVAFFGAMSRTRGHALTPNRGLVEAMFEHALALLVAQWHAMSLARVPFYVKWGHALASA